jgi:isoleucyl-tRNA synthetase
LNVKEVAFSDSAEGLVSLVAKPNYRVLGPRFQNRTEEVAKAIRELGEEALAAFKRGDPVSIELGEDSFSLEEGEVEVEEEARGGLVVQSDGRFTAALDPTLDDGLRSEGLARELVNRIQRLRKEAGLEITDRISLGVFGPEEIRSSAQTHEAFITGETLASTFRVGSPADDEGYQVEKDVDLDGVLARIGLSAAGSEA